MKKRLLLILLLLFTLFPCYSVSAIKTQDYFKIEDNVEDKDDIEHSLFMFGNNVDSRKKIEGILFLVGNNINSNSENEYGIYAGNNVEINGKIEKDLFAAGNIITINNETSIGRDAYLAANTINIKTNVDGNIFATCEALYLENITIKGDITVNCSNITIKDDVIIEGTLKYNEDAKVSGINEELVPNVKTYKKKVKEVTLMDILYTKSISAITLIVTAIIIHLIFKKLYDRLSKDIDANKLIKNLCSGFCFLIIVPIISVLLFLSTFGLSLGIIALLIYGIMLYLSIILSSTVIGNNVLTKLFKRKDNPYLSIIIGIVITTIFTSIPYIASAIYLILILIGLGLFVEMIKGK